MYLKPVLLFIFVIACISLTAQEPRMVLPVGHSGSVNLAIFSPDERFVLTGSSDGSAKLWDKITGRLLQTYSATSGSVVSIDFSPDGSLIAIGYADSAFAVWETISGKTRYHYNVPNNITAVQFNKDATQLMLSGQKGDSIRIIDVAQGYETETIYARGAYQGVYYNRSDTTVFRLIDYKLGVCWKVNDSTSDCALLSARNWDYISGFAILPNRTGYITASHDSTVNIFNDTGYVLKRLKLPFSIKSLSLSADGSKVIFVSRSTPYAEIWSLKDTSMIASAGINDPQYSNKMHAAFAPRGNYVFMGLENNDDVLLCEMKDSLEVVQQYFIKHRDIEYVVFSRKKVELLFGAEEPMLLSSRENKPLAQYKGFAYNKRALHLALNDSLAIVESGKTQVEVWDTDHQKLIYTLEHGIKRLGAIAISPSTEQMVTVDYRTNEIRQWETRTGKLLQKISPGIIDADTRQVLPYWGVRNKPPEPAKLIDSIIPTIYSYDKVEYHPTKNIVATYSSDMDGVVLWDMNTGKMITNLQIGTDGVTDVSFSADAKNLAAVGRQGVAVILNLETKKITPLPINNYYTVSRVDIDPASYKVVTAGYDSTIRTWSIKTGNIFKETKADAYISDCRFSASGENILATSGEYLQVYGAASLKRFVNWNANNKSIRSIRPLTSKGDWLVRYWNGTPTVYNPDSNTYRHLVEYGNAENVQLTKKNDRVFTLEQNWVNVFKPSGEYLSSYFSIDSVDHMAVIADNYYFSSPNAAKKVHYVTPDLKVISFEQLDVKYNRPDMVLQQIGYPDSSLIQSYRRAYEKRIRKLNIDTTMFSGKYNLPVANIENRSAISYEQQNGTLQLVIKAKDSTSYLDRLNVWVNDVPVWGANGIRLQNKKRRIFDTTVTIRLSAGENTIETSVTNNRGAESYRMPLNVQYTPKVKQKEKVHFIGIGIDQFADASHNLNWSVKDIRDISHKLKSRYKDIIIDTLFNKAVTRQNVLALKKKLQRLSEDDKVIISYSGHGLLSKDLDYYLSTYDVNFTRPEQNGLSYDELQSLIDGIKPRKKLVLIDACHSGEVDKEEIAKIEANTKKLDSMGVKTKSTIKITEKKKIGMTNSFELMQNLFVNVGRGTGATVISAAGGMQYAQERGDLKNGVFTYSILEAFNKNATLTVSQLRKIVGERVIQLTNGLQKPTSRNETNFSDWAVW